MSTAPSTRPPSSLWSTPAPILSYMPPSSTRLERSCSRWFRARSRPFNPRLELPMSQLVPLTIHRPLLKFGVKTFFGKIRGKIEILSTQNLFCWKIAIFCPEYFFHPRVPRRRWIALPIRAWLIIISTRTKKHRSEQTQSHFSKVVNNELSFTAVVVVDVLIICASV